MRLRIDLAYDGSGFSGWAAQPDRRTVQGVLSAALTTVLRAPEPVRLTVAGRTDAGVHARGQVAHADVDESAFASLPGRSDRDPATAAVTRLAGVLPDDVVVHRVSIAPPGFDARFSALRRRYRYRVVDDPASADPLRRNDTVRVRDRLDAAAMDEAARALVGLHDFAAFCKRREGATTVRTLLDYRWTRTGEGVLEATVVADAFCHSMVRALVGAVVPVGEGRHPVGFPAEVLAGGVRDPRVTVMPAHGLSLEEVVYPPDDELAARAEEARAVRTLPG
ncbi:tRNA pseudouridine(38-40) synthase TruA [Phycicoccus sp. CSK15P-2]|uniref:tRNA pseudouridine(38-40) synthase TruA n=1 Tax=Phycicoccus sp. CSK15P-2 TaxID=2807627 RepID=UPI00194FD9B6|nr:tRNA pseudouridine(38-40) synthase TruA [Phycicoccus sp. CSK15P-2]MBM6405700.1 tRNA pseudouridine(38-40) synthase TruA [Phycicoccus sp. CSK15P-2]